MGRSSLEQTPATTMTVATIPTSVRTRCMPTSSRPGPQAFPGASGSVGEGPDRARPARAGCRGGSTASTTSMPPFGLASACSSSARSVTRQCGVRVAAQRPPGRRRGACRRACSYDAACSGAPCSRVAKIEPPSSLATTIVRSGRGSSGSDDERGRRRAGRSRRRRSAIARVLCGRPSAAPIAVETVPSMPARPRLAEHHPPLADRVRRRPSGRGRGSGCWRPTKSSPPGGLAALTTAATSYGVRPGCSATKASMPAPTAARSAVRHSSSQAGSSASARRRPTCSAGDRATGRVGPATRRRGPRRPRRPRARAAAAPDATASGARTPRPARSARRGRCRAAAGRCGSGSSPVRDPLLGSASSGQPARSASVRAGGPASSPATTTVRGPQRQRGSASASSGSRRHG